MPKESIISNFEAFSQKFPQLVSAQKDSKRMIALRRYFAEKMVISLGSMPTDGQWPEIVYPTKLKLKKDLERIEKMRSDVSKRHNEWQGTLNRAKMDGATIHLKKFVEPTYWKHVTKMMTDSDYRADAQSVKLPVHLVSHKRYKPMVEMFVNNLDYRKQLTETVQNSIVYKDKPQLGRYAGELQALREQRSQHTVNQTKKSLTEIDEEIDMYRELLNWAKK
ncbi:MAG: hypothetical protein Q7R47_06690 [Candidatus Diapherotrites archaeon]|nr:hypothetical protein [Candidatus Diapherotrites archaeon]